VIVCAGELEPAVVRQYLQWGIDDIILKPIKLDLFIKALKKVMD